MAGNDMPAGWYADAQVEGGLRYWDGRAWTSSRTRAAGVLPPPPPVGSSRPAVLPPPPARVQGSPRRAVPPPPPGPPDGSSPWGVGAPGVASGTPSSAPGRRPRRGVPASTWIVGGLVVVALLLALVGGVGSFLVVLGLVALLTGVYVTISRRRSWALLPASRPVGAGVMVAALIVTGIGGGVASAEHPSGSSSVAAEVVAPTDGATDSPGDPAVGGGDTNTETPAPGAGASGSADGGQADPETATAPPDGTSVVAADTTVTTGPALAVLETLAVKGRAPKTGYDRVGQFGTAWLDVDRNGCDTRNDILARDLTNVTRSGPCKVLAGALADRYTGTTIDFVRGNTTSTLVQIDHVVALSDAWQKGAQQLTEAQRISFANDPLNLWATDGATNEAKSDGDAATWLPPNKGFRCEYAARQVSVKATYGLWVTQAEHDALAGILAACPGQPAVSSSFTPAPASAAVGGTSGEPSTVPVPAAEPEPAQVAPAEPAAPAAPAAPAPASVTYQNCAAARAAGAAPILRGEPGYSSKLDRDNDGIACE